MRKEKNGRTAWQRIVGCVASRVTAVPPRYLILINGSTKARYNTVCEVRCKFTAAWVREEEKASENRQRKTEADKVDVASGMTVGSLTHFRAALIGPTQGLPKCVGCADWEA